MDASRELKALNSNEMTVEQILNKLQNEAEEIAQKKYLVKVLKLLNTIEKMIVDGDFEKHNVYSLCINQEYSKTNIGYLLKYRLKNSDGKELKNTLSSKQGEIVGKLKPDFDRIWKIQLSNVGSIYDEELEIVLKPGVKNELLKGLLSEELQKSLTYSELQADIPLNDTQNKRMKL
jgi:predicted house-cleaning noncanonical NTP pyrophosphatase (MazG superfamily)